MVSVHGGPVHLTLSTFSAPEVAEELVLFSGPGVVGVLLPSRKLGVELQVAEGEALSALRLIH